MARQIYDFSEALYEQSKMNMKTPKSLLPDDGEEEGIIMNAQNVDFSEYEWMGEEEIEEFDRKVEEEFWEEAFMEACFTEMLEEEESQWRYFISNTDLQGDDKFLAQGAQGVMVYRVKTNLMYKVKKIPDQETSCIVI
ncbi:hypothetical protein KUTeg_005163 [Tegillarca granosa]|uniref:Uncharacterized protein n=1 Tax=Tegillarca granosa TaxID=220873 RepID=A0ABQ9FIZ6_TEGGR|nr:hypothetical protein KUTeg_005163 [Tegillarca granosa]